MTSRAKPRYTREDTEHAAESARRMTADSPVLRATMAVMIAARRLYMVSRQVLDDEINNGWEVEHPELVIRTLEMSAERKSLEQFSHAELRAAIESTVAPYLRLIDPAEPPPPEAEPAAGEAVTP